jgi:hypothetical protein
MSLLEALADPGRELVKKLQYIDDLIQKDKHFEAGELAEQIPFQSLKDGINRGLAVKNACELDGGSAVFFAADICDQDIRDVTLDEIAETLFTEASSRTSLDLAFYSWKAAERISNEDRKNSILVKVTNLFLRINQPQYAKMAATEISAPSVKDSLLQRCAEPLSL